MNPKCPICGTNLNKHHESRCLDVWTAYGNNQPKNLFWQDGEPYLDFGQGYDKDYAIKEYSSDLNAALQINHDCFHIVEHGYNGDWSVEDCAVYKQKRNHEIKPIYGHGDTLALAICRWKILATIFMSNP